ncbi:ribonuclease H-like domain-containing protein [Amylocystis lapponica]|nr:ribonuclease H-like domain-containing protein [Amylocystis lapponica]
MSSTTSHGVKQRAPSSNWLALQKNLPPASSESTSALTARDRRKIARTSESSRTTDRTSLSASFPRGHVPEPSTSAVDGFKNGESLPALRQMVSGKLEYSSIQQNPGKYLALDCEMVGVGPEGKESSLARVSLVNYNGAVQLDVFVRQRERVVDYRTQYSGVRASDMIHARPFAEVQKQVAGLLEDRILVGHAIHNDLKVLLLSHPRQMIRDTQVCAFKHKLTRSNRIALRHLVQQELGITIQDGEHSSVTDARATMAVYRIHRKEWENTNKPDAPAFTKRPVHKRKRSEPAGEQSVAAVAVTNVEFPGGGKKGISSGLSTVVRHRETNTTEKKWWKELGSGSRDR